VQAFRCRTPTPAALSGLFRTLEFRQLQQALPQTAERRPKDYRAILDTAELAALVERLQSGGIFAVDTETTSPDPMRAELVGLSFSTEADRAVYIPAATATSELRSNSTAPSFWTSCGGSWRIRRRARIGQNIKYDAIVPGPARGESCRAWCSTPCWPPYLLDPAKRAHNLDQIALDFLGLQDHSLRGAGRQAQGRGHDLPRFAGGGGAYALKTPM